VASPTRKLRPSGGCAVGTIKSRVARARETLLEMLEGRQPLPVGTAASLDDDDDQTITRRHTNTLGCLGRAVSPHRSERSVELNWQLI